MSRLFQDRITHNGWDSGSFERHTNSDAYSQPVTDTDCNRKSDAYANSNGHGHADRDSHSYSHSYRYAYCHTNSHCYGYSYCYSYRYSYRDSHSYGYAYGNGHCDCNTYINANTHIHSKTLPDTKAYPAIKASADSAAAPVVADDWVPLSTLNIQLQRSTLNEKFQDTPRTNTHGCAYLYRRWFSERVYDQHHAQQR